MNVNANVTKESLSTENEIKIFREQTRTLQHKHRNPAFTLLRFNLNEICPVCKKNSAIIGKYHEECVWHLPNTKHFPSILHKDLTFLFSLVCRIENDVYSVLLVIYCHV
jgi:hypothetical protein